jgi:RNA polymerase-binding transcription factor DksA
MNSANQQFKTRFKAQRVLLETRLRQMVATPVDLFNQQTHEWEQRHIRTELELVSHALERLEGDQYGLCIRCQSPIPTERLERMPYSEMCVSCQSQAERGALRQTRYHYTY